jgi:hypothetical protein
MITKPLLFRSVADLPPLTWSELAYGYSKQFLGWRTPVEFAAKKVQQGQADRDVRELASVGKDQVWKVSELLQQLAAKEGREPASASREKWLFIFLRWLYENRDRFEDPLQEVEEVYADFDYPEAMKGFVRFLPPTDGYHPELHSKEENRERLYRLWREYLEKEARRFRA